MDTPKYLKVELHSGLCNKLYCLMSAINIALEHNLILVEPYFGWRRPIRMLYVWNIDKLLSGIPELKWCSLDVYQIKFDNGEINQNSIIYKSGEELWEHSESILTRQREECILYREYDICCRVIKLLEPSDYILNLFGHDFVHNNIKSIAVHFRTEKDWKKYSINKQKNIPENEQCWTSNNNICDMVINEFGTQHHIFIVNGGNGTIINKLFSDKNITCTYVYKYELEYEQNGAMHWYICCLAENGFVGLSRSTFSNIVCLRRELDRVTGGCWIYNYRPNGNKILVRRVDAGLQPEAYKSITVVTNII